VHYLTPPAGWIQQHRVIDRYLLLGRAELGWLSYASLALTGFYSEKGFPALANAGFVFCLAVDVWL